MRRPTPYTPDADQERDIEAILASPNMGALDGSEVGTGKTLVATEVALRMWADRVLIIAPPGTFGVVDEDSETYEGWSGTVFRQSEGATRLEMVSNRNKTEKASLAALLNGEPGWFFISREMFVRLDWEKVDNLNKPKFDPDTGEITGFEQKSVRKGIWAKLNFDVAIYDEVQAISSRKSNGFKSWAPLKATKKIAASADWFGNQLVNMWGTTFPLWPETIEPVPDRWADLFLKSEYDNFAWNKKKYVGEKEPGKFAATLPCYVKRHSTLGEMPTPSTRYVDLTPNQRRMYDDLEARMATRIAEQHYTLEQATTLWIRLRQLALAEFTLEPTDDPDKPAVTFALNAKSSKIDEAKSIIADHPGKFVLFTDSEKFARVLAHQLGDAALYTGKNKNREAEKAEFIAGKRQHFVCVTSAGGAGLDGLQHASNSVILFSRDTKEYMNRQAIGRVWRRGQTNEVRVWEILAKNTGDHDYMSKQMRTALQNAAAKRKG